MKYYTSYDFEVCIDGKPVKEYYHADENVYIEGRRGSEFTLKFRNKTYEKVLVVLSVDGLSVMDGKPASDKAGGYICDSCSTIEIPGWRIDSREIAKFKFQPQGDRNDKTYVEELASEGFSVDPANQGVIGIMVFKHQPVYLNSSNNLYVNSTYVHHYYHHYDPYYPPNGLHIPSGIRGINCSASGGASSDAYGATPKGAVSYNSVGQNASASSVGMINQMSVVATSYSAPSLGTGFGEAQNFKTQQVEFKRQPNAAWIGEIFYDTRTNLQKKGIVFSDTNIRTPRAFPAMYNDKGCYVPKSRR